MYLQSVVVGLLLTDTTQDGYAHGEVVEILRSETLTLNNRGRYSDTVTTEAEAEKLVE